MDEIGKRVGSDIYVHVGAIASALDAKQASHIKELISQLDRSSTPEPNVVKVSKRGDRVSLLCYQSFDEDPFPQLAASWIFGANGERAFRSYEDSLNPPILHRKELLVPGDWPNRQQWVELSALAESIGLFDDTKSIGFRTNWERLIASKGFRVSDGTLVPIGNEVGLEPLTPGDPFGATQPEAEIQRHLTALSRGALSAPIQLLLRSGLLTPGVSVFDYGCGRGTDIASLAEAGFEVAGWDPYFAPSSEPRSADLVNLGFVVNVIEDPAERVEAIRAAAKLARRALIVSVMLNSRQGSGVPYNDGLITSRRTFQKYFSQEELRDYIEHVLGRAPVMAGPGIALHFADEEWEQRFVSRRYQRRDLARRLLELDSVRSRVAARTAPNREASHGSGDATLVDSFRPLLDRLWALVLDLGRWPEPEEISESADIYRAFGSLARAKALISRNYDQSLLASASRARSDDVLVYLASDHFKKRKPYRSLETKLRRDIKALFGNYRSAHMAATTLLLETGKPERILAASRQAAANGLGYLESDHSLQLHVSHIDRLPAVLRVYIACGLLLWDKTSEVQLVKIHVQSGKLTLLEYEDFESSPLPLLRRRIKVNLRRLDYDIFEYGSEQHPATHLFFKSRYLSEEDSSYVKQIEFEEAMAASALLEDTSEHGLNEKELTRRLELCRKRVAGMELLPSVTIPDLDQQCGEHLTYRDFVECGETQKVTGLPNVPLNPASYNALFQLASDVLDPVIEYFGSVELTYGFSSNALSKQIQSRIAPDLDQHAACEVRSKGRFICTRLGAACDFLVRDEDMCEVASWIIDNVAFDRLYWYGHDRPIHVSVGPEARREAYQMVETRPGLRVPRRFRRA